MTKEDVREEKEFGITKEHNFTAQINKGRCKKNTFLYLCLYVN